jgi:hypothetical protein
MSVSMSFRARLFAPILYLCIILVFYHLDVEGGGQTFNYVKTVVYIVEISYTYEIVSCR